MYIDKVVLELRCLKSFDGSFALFIHVCRIVLYVRISGINFVMFEFDKNLFKLYEWDKIGICCQVREINVFKDVGRLFFFYFGTSCIGMGYDFRN